MESTSAAKLLQGSALPALEYRDTFVSDSEVEERDSVVLANDHAVRQGVANLTSTIVGGGLLSLPYAFRQCGLALGVVLLILTASASGYTVQLLIRAGLLSGADTFEGIANAAFGRRGSVVTAAGLCTLTWLVVIAYTILLGDVVMPVIQFFAHISDQAKNSRDLLSIRTGVQLFALCAISPLTCTSDLSALKFTSVASICSICLLIVAIVLNSYQDGFGAPTPFATPGDGSDILWVGGLNSLNAFSIISVSFLCHFNVLPVCKSITTVTKPRAMRLISYTMGMCCVLYIVASVFGYLNFRDLTCGNVLLNYDTSSSKLHLITCGRMGLFVCLCCAMPLMIVPCRENAEKLMMNCRSSDHQLPKLLDDLDAGEHHTKFSLSRRGLHAAVIMLGALISAVFIPGVQVVWTFMGSTVACIISYILPPLFYIQIKKMKTPCTNVDSKLICAWAVLGCGVLLVISCTTMAIIQQIQGEDMPSFCK